MMFKNRAEAAHLLAQKLAKYQGQRPLVLAIPRGAVPMGRIIADCLGGELDVVLVRKLGAPGEPELAVGAVDETGAVTLNEYARGLGVSDAYVEAERQTQLAALRQRRDAYVEAARQTQLAALRQRRAGYTPLRPPIDPRGRAVIVVDNGIATGATMIAALRALHAKEPARLIAAAAVVPAETLRKIAAEADETVWLEAPIRFFAVGAFFEDFSQVSDEEVAAILLEGSPRKRAVGE